MKPWYKMLEEMVEATAPYTGAVYFDADDSNGAFHVEVQIPSGGSSTTTGEGESTAEAVRDAYKRWKR